MMVDSGKEKPSNDRKGHDGWYLQGSTWKRTERVVRKTRRSLIVPEWRSQKAWWEGSRTQSEFQGAQGLQDQSRHDLLSRGPVPASAEGVWLLHPFLLSEPQLSLALGSLTPGVEALLCPHLWRRRPREAEAGASKASGRAGVRLSQKEGKARPLRVKRFIRKDLEPSWLDLQGYLKGRSRMVVGYNLPRESTLKEERVCIG